MDPNACLAAMDAANQDRLDADELALIAAEVQRAQKARGRLDGVETDLFKAATLFGDQAVLAAKIEKRNRLINIVKEAEILRMTRRASEAMGDASRGLEAVMVGVNTPFDGARASVDGKTKGIMALHVGGMVADLERAGLRAVFNSGALNREVAKELWDLSLTKPTGNATTSQQAKQIAAIVHKYRRAAIERENRAGAVIRYRSGYVTRQTHDGVKMRRAGFDAWRATIENRLDWDTMEIAPEDREGFLRSVFATQTTGIRLTGMEGDESGFTFAFKGPGNLAKKESASRVVLFKSADDWFTYNEGFGRAALNESILLDIEHSARATALMDTFGTNPRAMFDRIRDKEERRLRDRDPVQANQFRRKMLEWQFAELDGSVNIVGAHTSNQIGATVGRGIRAIQTMASLGGAVLSSIVDLANVAAERRFQGRSIADSWMDSLNSVLEGFSTTGEKRRVAEMIGVGIDGVLGDFTARFAAQDDIPGRMSKTMRLFFKLNLLGPWTDAVKRGTGLMMARDLAMAAEGPWSAVPPDMQRMLRTQGLGEADWPAVQAAVITAPDGRKYVAPDALPQGATRKQQRDRDRLSAALAGYYADSIDFASPSPGARERAMLRFGLQPGTPAGEAVRYMMQFKAFPVTVISKTAGRMIYGRGAKTIGDALIRGHGDRLGIASYIAGAWALGFIAMQAKEIAKGREPREVNSDSATAALLQAGALGIYGDFLLGEANRFGGGPLDTVMGPTAGDASKFFEILQRIRGATFRGEAPDVAAESLRFVVGNTPFVNIFYTKTALDYLILYQLQEMANPGYLRRMERRMKSENNQEFFVPPSEVIPRGGGSRVFEGVR